ncbi:unnamed protein product [Mytilus coruscus]|uniref:Sterile alpha motif domain-containing protein 5 n=1 Tax=Mytilus coruscus TaxID=42192 RepID=A0A6J8C3P6_MYTCO|nr:unnamed protein product [Mytilus coruscus]
MMSDNIVANWLGSLNLDYYTQAFFDNGYDELEICKQIGDADLDAIGVTKNAHREKVLRAVTRLKEEGGTSVYFTLESSQYSCEGDVNCLPTDTISTCSSNISYTNSQLLKIIRGRIFSDNIDLSTLPYVKPDGSVCTSSIAALAVRYSEELKASIDSVTMAIEELQQCILNGNSELFYSATPVSSSSLASLSSEPGCHSYTCRPELPPPIPSIPPPTSSHIDKAGSLHSIPTRYSGNASIKTYDYVVLDSGMCCIPKVKSDKAVGDNRKSGTLGKLFRNIGIRRSGRKQGFKQHEGDPNAYDITMSDEDRMALMLMVKEGKITTQHAIEVVKRFEDEKRKEILQLEKDRKKKKGRPVKSPSAGYTDSPKKCGVCQKLVKMDNSPTTHQMCSDPSHRFECFQHRRVHSVSHLEHSARSPDAPRSLSCTPTRAAPGSTITSPVNFYLPNHSPRVYAPVIPHELKMHGLSTLECQHGNLMKTLACVHDNSSRTSSLSFESEMDCQGPTHSDLVPLRSDEVAYCSNSSAVSMASDTSPPAGATWGVKAETGGHSRLKCCSTTDTTKSASSTESTHSGSSGMRSLHSASPMSGKSSVSMEDNVLSGAACPMAVKVHTDFVPGKTDTDFLKLEKGDVIFVLNKTTSGLCWGNINGRSGWFKASHVEPLEHHPAGPQLKLTAQRNNTKRFKPKTVTELLQKLGLQHLEELFVQNGFDHLESFAEIDEDDLNALHITDPQKRTKLLTAADFLSDIVVDHIPNVNRYLMYTPPCASPAGEQRSYPSSRDSGCYASWEHIHNKNHNIHNQSKFHPLHSNKENVFPENDFQVSTHKSSNGGKIESNYSEEDREVFELIKQNLDSNHGDSSQKDGDMVTCSYAETQTSPSDSSKSNPKSQIHVSKIQQQTVIENQTPKTFVRKSVPRMGSVVRDAQVQVMSPLGTSERRTLPSDAHKRVSSDSINSCASSQSDGHRRILSESNSSLTPLHNVPNYDTPKLHTINGSVTGSPVAGYRKVKKSLVNLVASKLASEAIDLSQEPYSSQCGACGIPPLFIQRYSDELKTDISSIAIVLDQIRIHQLQTSRKPVIPAVDIATTCSKACDLDVSSVDGFFMSIGLPMYSETLKSQGVTSLEQLLTMSDQTIKEKSSASSRHVRRISHALDWVQRKISASRDPVTNSETVEDHV